MFFLLLQLSQVMKCIVGRKASERLVQLVAFPIFAERVVFAKEGRYNVRRQERTGWMTKRTHCFVPGWLLVAAFSLKTFLFLSSGEGTGPLQQLRESKTAKRMKRKADFSNTSRLLASRRINT